MRFTKIKNMSEMGNLNNIATLETIDGKIQSITIEYDNKKYRIQKMDGYSDNLVILVQEEPELKIKYTLEGTVNGVEMYFNNSWGTVEEAVEFKQTIVGGELEIVKFEFYEDKEKIL